MKFAADRPFADPEKAARKLIELANAAAAVQDGRIHIELLNLPFQPGQSGFASVFVGFYPVALTVWLYPAKPAVQLATLVVAIDTAGLMVTV